MTRVEFAGAIGRPGQEGPSDLPQVAFAGRSNVGKSSLINTLLGRKSLARVSKQPGRTREINFFRVEDRFFLVDLPGYGFARAPEEVRRAWGPMVESYLSTAAGLLGVVLLLDSRHGPTRDDRRMVDYLARLDLPTLLVLTKIDKLNRSGRKAAVERVREILGVPADQVAVTSALTDEGRDTLWRSVLALVEEGETGEGAGGRGVGPGPGPVKPGV